MCDRADPESASLHRESRKSANFSLSAILPGPRIIAIHSLDLPSQAGDD